MQSQQQWTVAISATAITVQWAVTTTKQPTCNREIIKCFETTINRWQLQYISKSSTMQRCLWQQYCSAVAAALSQLWLAMERGELELVATSNNQPAVTASISNQHHNSNAVLIATMLCCTYSFIRESSHHAVTVTAIEKSKATIGKKSLEQRQPTNQLAFEWQHHLGNWKGEVAVFITAVRVLSEWQQSQQKSGDLQRKQDYIYTGAL